MRKIVGLLIISLMIAGISLNILISQEKIEKISKTWTGKNKINEVEITGNTLYVYLMRNDSIVVPYTLKIVFSSNTPPLVTESDGKLRVLVESATISLIIRDDIKRISINADTLYTDLFIYESNTTLGFNARNTNIDMKLVGGRYNISCDIVYGSVNLIADVDALFGYINAQNALIKGYIASNSSGKIGINIQDGNLVCNGVGIICNVDRTTNGYIGSIYLGSGEGDINLKINLVRGGISLTVIYKGAM